MTGALVSAPVSIGELVDKITILEIKSERLSSPAALENVRRELALLSAEFGKLELGDPEVARIRGDLKTVNESLWEIEDDIRDKEAKGEFDDRFARARHSPRRSLAAPRSSGIATPTSRRARRGADSTRRDACARPARRPPASSDRSP